MPAPYARHPSQFASAFWKRLAAQCGSDRLGISSTLVDETKKRTKVVRFFWRESKSIWGRDRHRFNASQLSILTCRLIPEPLKNLVPYTPLIRPECWFSRGTHDQRALYETTDLMRP